MEPFDGRSFAAVPTSFKPFAQRVKSLVRRHVLAPSVPGSRQGQNALARTHQCDDYTPNGVGNNYRVRGATPVLAAPLLSAFRPTTAGGTAKNTSRLPLGDEVVETAWLRASACPVAMISAINLPRCLCPGGVRSAWPRSNYFIPKPSFWKSFPKVRRKLLKSTFPTPFERGIATPGSLQQDTIEPTFCRVATMGGRASVTLTEATFKLRCVGAMCDTAAACG